jgi:hypothetical protein
MTLLAASYHTRVVTLGWMAKTKGVSSRASILISVKVLVGNVVTTGHHARAVSPHYLLEEKAIRIKNKRHEWAWKQLHPGQVHLAFYKGTHR